MSFSVLEVLQDHSRLTLGKNVLLKNASTFLAFFGNSQRLDTKQEPKYKETNKTQVDTMTLTGTETTERDTGGDNDRLSLSIVRADNKPYSRELLQPLKCC